MPAPITNFGGNVAFTPAQVVAPIDTSDVLACLDTHRSSQIRARGSLHSWSAVAATDGVALDMRHFDQIAIRRDAAGTPVAVDAGAGCSLRRLLDYLGVHGCTLPVYPVIGAQTVAGAIATGTHGTGKSSLSHYVQAVTLAAYDSDGMPRIYEWDGGDELRAARCGLGCTGVLLAVRLPVEPAAQLCERVEWFDGLDALLAVSCNHPRTQFYLIPWSWRWLAQLRRADPRKPTVPSMMTARATRTFRTVVVDGMFTGAVRTLTLTGATTRLVAPFFRVALPIIAPSGVGVRATARSLQTLHHDLYSHVECELFVPSDVVVLAAAFVEWALRTCAGERRKMPEQIARDFSTAVERQVVSLRGSYMHDYPITFRAVHRDDTMLSMTSGVTDVWYSISLITYQRDTGPFNAVYPVLAKALADAYGARPHWGKLCPLDAKVIKRLYPELDAFRGVCASVDPRQVFVNDFARRVIGFASRVREEAFS